MREPDLKEQEKEVRRKLKEIENSQSVMEEAEQFQREIGCISPSALLKQFNI